MSQHPLRDETVIIGHGDGTTVTFSADFGSGQDVVPGSLRLRRSDDLVIRFSGGRSYTDGQHGIQNACLDLDRKQIYIQLTKALPKGEYLELSYQWRPHPLTGMRLWAQDPFTGNQVSITIEQLQAALATDLRPTS